MAKYKLYIYIYIYIIYIYIYIYIIYIYSISECTYMYIIVNAFITPKMDICWWQIYGGRAVLRNGHSRRGYVILNLLR